MVTADRKKYRESLQLHLRLASALSPRCLSKVLHDGPLNLITVDSPKTEHVRVLWYNKKRALTSATSRPAVRNHKPETKTPVSSSQRPKLGADTVSLTVHLFHFHFGGRQVILITEHL